MTRKLTSLLTIAIAVCGSTAGQSSEPAPDQGPYLFAEYCSSCHGRTGAGDGPMAAQLSSTLPDLRTLTARNGSVFPRERIVAMIDGRDSRSVHGGADMPVWGFQFRREDGMTAAGEHKVQARIDAIVGYIGSLQE